MIVYLICISCLSIVFLLLLLTYLGVVFSNSKLQLFVKSQTFSTIIKKILLSLFTLFMIFTVLFFLIELLPDKYFHDDYSFIESKNSNLIKKLFSFYYDILPIPKKVCSSNYLEGDKLVCSTYEYKIINLGYSSSYMKNIAVTTIIKEKCSISFMIGIISYFLQCLIGFPLGVLLAKHENKLATKTFNLFHSIIRITPSILYFYLFVILFMVGFSMPVLFDFDNILTYIPPLTALTISSSISIAYFVKKYILIELNKDYVKFARCKGLSENTILFKHVLRNSIIPFIRTIPYSILACFSGYYLLEASFNIPGIGQTLIYAIKLHDIYLIRGLLILFSFLSVIAYLSGDLLMILFERKKVHLKEDLKWKNIIWYMMDTTKISLKPF